MLDPILTDLHVGFLCKYSLSAHYMPAPVPGDWGASGNIEGFPLAGGI